VISLFKLLKKIASSILSSQRHSFFFLSKIQNCLISKIPALVFRQARFTGMAFYTTSCIRTDLKQFRIHLCFYEIYYLVDIIERKDLLFTGSHIFQIRLAIVLFITIDIMFYNIKIYISLPNANDNILNQVVHISCNVCLLLSSNHIAA